MLSEKPVLTLCHGIILNGKHKWKPCYIPGRQGVCKIRKEKAIAMRECYWVAQNYLANQLWHDDHRLSAPPQMTENTSDK